MAKRNRAQLVGNELASSATAKGLTEALEQQPWFNKLDDDTKLFVEQQGPALASDLQSFGIARINVASRLTDIYEKLGPLKQFERFIKFFRLKRRTVYRAIKEFKNAKRLPGPILNVALARGVNILGDSEERPFGVYTEAVKKNPPPERVTEAQAVTYIDEIENLRKGLPKLGPAPKVEPEYLGPSDPKDLMKEAYRFVMVRYGRLAGDMTVGKRAAWMKTLCGMLLQVTGVSGERPVQVIAPPEDFKAVRGRPRMH